uniref:Globin domain-containing protein n=1 Tax=Sphaeramia orbicularis TaxID=375764 RepID=A0A673AW70_9TELE
MVEWSDQERSIITSIFDHVLTHLFSCRCLIVYPWTQRYFGCPRNQGAARSGSFECHALEKLHIDPDNFKISVCSIFDPEYSCIVFGLSHSCWLTALTIVVAAKMGTAFTADIQAAFQKFLSVVVNALGRQYH